MAKAGKNQEKKASTPKTRKPAKPAKPAGAASSPPMIDTSLAAANAAKLLAAKFQANTASDADAPQVESAMFKNLKAGVNKPASAGISSLLEKSHGPEPVRSHPQQKQVGRNQTFGADVTRSGVPRRTPG